MNLTDLHYVVEIDKSGSISKAAKELYVAQPNLSKAIKHLEREFGISIFERSSKGVKATREGQKFLEYAKRIIYEIEEMKRDCSDLGKENLSFKITVPRASYISSAFAEFIGMQSKETAIKAEFQESSSMHAIENVLQNGYSMGIIRYLCENEPYFQSLLDLKGLDAELLAELPYMILTSADGDLAKRELKTREELEEKFGPRVAFLVDGESEDKSKSWVERKGATVERLKTATRDEKILALADKLSNIRSTARDYLVLGDEVWQRFNQKDKEMQGWYYKGVAEALKEFKGHIYYEEYVMLCERVFG